MLLTVVDPPQADLLEHMLGIRVLRKGEAQHASQACLLEREVDARRGRLGGVAATPGLPVELVGDLDVGALTLDEHEPAVAHDAPGCPFFDRPEAVAVPALVVDHPGKPAPAVVRVARRAAAHESHHDRVCVQRMEGFQIV